MSKIARYLRTKTSGRSLYNMIEDGEPAADRVLDAMTGEIEEDDKVKSHYPSSRSLTGKENPDDVLKAMMGEDPRDD